MLVSRGFWTSSAVSAVSVVGPISMRNGITGITPASFLLEDSPPPGPEPVFGMGKEKDGGERGVKSKAYIRAKSSLRDFAASAASEITSISGPFPAAANTFAFQSDRRCTTDATIPASVDRHFLRVTSL